MVLALALAPAATGFMAPSPWSRRATARFAAPAPTENGLLWKATATDQKLPKIEQIKVDSQSLREPVREEFKNDEIFVSHVSRHNPTRTATRHPTVSDKSNAEEKNAVGAISFKSKFLWGRKRVRVWLAIPKPTFHGR